MDPFGLTGPFYKDVVAQIDVRPNQVDTSGVGEGDDMSDSSLEACLDTAQGALLRTIEGEVIPRLILAHRSARRVPAAPCESSGSGPRPSPADVERFAALVLGGRAGDALAYVQGLQTLGMTSETIFLDVLAPAARIFGEMWESERTDFVEVTVALRRLQNIAHELTPGRADPAEEPPKAGRRILLVALPGEQHVFGAQLVGELLRRSGWDVWDAPGAGNKDILALVAREWFAVVGLSLSAPEKVDALAGLIRQLRRASLNRDVRVMVGGKPFEDQPERVALVGADATAQDARDAVLQAQRMLELLT